MIDHDFVGIINIGDERKSGHARYKEFKPSSKNCKFENPLSSLGFNIYQPQL